MADTTDIVIDDDFDDEPKKKGSPLTLIPIVLIGLGAGGYLGLTQLSDKVGGILADRAMAAPADDGYGGHEGDDYGGGDDPLASMHMVDNLIVNPARSGGSIASPRRKVRRPTRYGVWPDTRTRSTASS